jgi:hypothetical protein
MLMVETMALVSLPSMGLGLELAIRYYLDTEFIPETLTLMSIGIVSEDDRELYLVSTEIPVRELNSWLREHVIPQIGYNSTPDTWKPVKEIADTVRTFIGDDMAVEFWGDYSAYDFLMLSRLMGDFDSWPKKWPFLIYDIRQFAYHCDYGDLDETISYNPFNHHALEDAKWVKKKWELLVALSRQPDQLPESGSIN